MKYLTQEQLKPLLEVKPDSESQSDDLPVRDNQIGQWRESNFRLASEKNMAFQRELEERANRLNAGLWPFF